MNKVEIRNEDGRRLPWEKKCRRFIKKLLKRRDIRGWEVSILFCGNDMIQQLNKKYREMDQPTDILSFSQLETQDFRPKGLIPAGDIVISAEYIARHAADYGVTENEELKRLLIHGILHLEGFDHNGSDPQEQMLVMQEKLVKELTGEKII